jgi:acetate kinase
MSSDLVLTLNAGSSSLKVALFEPGPPPKRVFRTTIERVAPDCHAHAAAFEQVLGQLAPHGGLDRVSAIGHRVVHGGPELDHPVLLTPPVLAALRRVSVLDPAHMPAAIAVIEAASACTDLPQVACFDTSFHRTIPRAARIVPIPRRYEAAGVRRYGFHGLSYEFLLSELGRVAGPAAAQGRVVMAHLGSGASLAAVRGGLCVDTTMGFTPNSGIPMGTRSGDLEPGVVLYLLRQGGMDVAALDDMLSRRSGLLGVSETSADMRDLLSREASDPRAADAVALFCGQARKAIGAMAAAIGGVDTLVFAGGIGENSPAVRARACDGLAHLGVDVDPDRNAAGEPVISTGSRPCTVRVIRTDEEAVIARTTMGVLAAQHAP